MHAIRITCLPWSPRARARVGGRGAIASMLGLALCLVPLLAQAAAPPRHQMPMLAIYLCVNLRCQMFMWQYYCC